VVLQQRVLRDLHTAYHAEEEKKLLIMKKTLWKNNLTYVKDVYILYVHFIAIIIIVSEKKCEALLSYRPWYLIALSVVRII